MGTRTVWLGPPGSGKTTRILDAVRGRLHAFRDDFRIVVPTATMAEHLRNELAREGFTLRPGAIATVTGHAGELAPGAHVIDTVALEIALEQALSAHCPPAFEITRSMPGFTARLAATLEELTNAGCDADTWNGFASLNRRLKPLLRELGGVWTDVQDRLTAQGLITRHEWLRRAAQAARDGALPEVRAFYWDGFSRLGAAELDLVRAHGERGDVVVSLPAWSGAARGGLVQLRNSEFAIRPFRPVRPTPRKLLVRPATQAGECMEIARRVLEHHRGGRPWHEIGIVVRSKEPYAPALETVFARFGIPLRPYFAEPLEDHPAARLFSAVLEALLSDWNWEPVLDAALSPAGLAGACPAVAKFEYLVREKLPGAGLDELRDEASRVPGAEVITSFLDRLAAFDVWRELELAPIEWAARLPALGALLQPPGAADGSLGLTAERLAVWRARSAAAVAWARAIEQAAVCLPARPMALRPFLMAVRPALRRAEVRNAEFRRDAVRLIDAQEARQWELPVVFVCGLLEGVFPRAPHSDPILGESVRGALRRNGIAVRARWERDTEERFLLDVAFSRATSELILSHPRLNEKGEPALGAFALDNVPGLVEQPDVACDVALPAPVEFQRPTGRLAAPAHLRALAQSHQFFSPTGLEKFIECPFQFFASNTLRLKQPPAAPGERFDALQRGTLVHTLLAQYHRLRPDLLRQFRAEWARLLRKLRMPSGYRVEMERILIERSLRMYAANVPEQPGWEPHMEENFQFPVADSPAGSIEVRGRIDRFEVAPGGECVVYDYKYSRPSSVAVIVKDEENQRGLQAGLYIQALRNKSLRPIAFYYVALKSACETKGWDSAADLDARASDAVRLATRAAFEILDGRVAVAPIDQDSCAFCDFIDACRIREIGYGTSERASAAAGE